MRREEEEEDKCCRNMTEKEARVRRRKRSYQAGDREGTTMPSSKC